MAALPKLSECRILVVEDEPLIGLDVKLTLSAQGVQVVGPVQGVAPALQVVNALPLQAAVLDINLDGELSFPIADALASAGVPFLFLTAYGRYVLPAAYQHYPILSKPVSAPLLIGELERLLRL